MCCYMNDHPSMRHLLLPKTVPTDPPAVAAQQQTKANASKIMATTLYAGCLDTYSPISRRLTLLNNKAGGNVCASHFGLCAVYVLLYIIVLLCMFCMNIT